MKILFLPVTLALGSLFSPGLAHAGSTIYHATCKVAVSEDVNYRGYGTYTQLFGPLGYADSLQSGLITRAKGYKPKEPFDQNVIRVSLRTSYADFFARKVGSAYEIEKRTSFCYVSAEATGILPIEFYQESKDCQKSLKAVIDSFPNCIIKP